MNNELLTPEQIERLVAKSLTQQQSCTVELTKISLPPVIERLGTTIISKHAPGMPHTLGPVGVSFNEAGLAVVMPIHVQMPKAEIVFSYQLGNKPGPLPETSSIGLTGPLDISSNSWMATTAMNTMGTPKKVGTELQDVGPVIRETIHGPLAAQGYSGEIGAVCSQIDSTQETVTVVFYPPR